jgi:hypothetical protein
MFFNARSSIGTVTIAMLYHMLFILPPLALSIGHEPVTIQPKPIIP